MRGKFFVSPQITKTLTSLALLAQFFFPSLVSAAEKAAARTPERTELWVPSEELARVIEKSENKNAVLLTPEQYNALIRDAGKLKPEDAGKPPPTNAVVESIRLKGRVLDGESGITLHGEITAKALADDWSLVSVKLPWKSVGKLSTTDGALLDVPANSKKTTSLAAASALSLFIKGPALHRVAFDCVAPINHGSSPDERVLFFEPTNLPTVLELSLPVGSQITQGPSHETVGDVHRFILNTGASGTAIIAWRLQPPAGSAAHVTTQSLRGSCRVAESELTAAYDVQLSSTATNAPTREIAFNVTPASASVIAVEGEKVESWTQANAALNVKLSGEARSLQLRVELRMPVALPAKDTLPIELPAVVLAGAKQVPAIAEIGLDEGVEMLELRSSRGLAASVAEWDAASEKATAVIRKVSPRIVVDADARIFVSRDFAEIERIVNATSDVPIDHLKANLPADEELLEVNWQSGPKLEWKRVGQSVEIEWQQRVDARSAGKFTIKSRKKLPADAKPVMITNLTIDDAKKLAGYIALDHDPAWRIALKQTSGLEDRDARLTPVSGKMAWFALREFTLGIELQRRESIVDAEITAYALPRAKSVEIEGQIALDITGAPLRQIEVRVTKEQAKLLRLTSPLIAEQSFDEAIGAWKLTLARESTGRVNLRWRLSLDSTVALSLRERSEQQPNAQNTNAPEKAPTELVSRSETATLTATLPRFEIPAARRFRGSWVVEANTDTQLSFATQSLQPVDVMRVSAVEDYTPRHRLVAAFTYGSGAHELTVTATRHASSELAALVVSKLALTSVLGVDGSSKHEAVIDLRHSGEQFAHVRLPSGAQLLSIIVDGRAVKPVRGEGGAIAIPLPGGTAGRDTVTARLIYELPGDPWPGHGTRKLDPITFLGNAPILSTDWRVKVPDGFSYDKVATGMVQSGTFEPEGIVAKVNVLGSLVSSFNSVSDDTSISSVKVHLMRAETAQLRGNIDEAKDAFQDVLRLDPNNRTARRGMERVEQLKSEHYDTARDHTRAQMLAKVDEQWETKVPITSAAAPMLQVDSGSRQRALKEKMDRVIFPQVSFSDATLEEAIEFLRVSIQQREPLENEPPGESRNVNVVIKPDAASSASKISLDLKDISMADAIRYITELAGVAFVIEPNAVVILPAKEARERFAGFSKQISSESIDESHRKRLRERMDKIILPRVSMTGATLEEAIEFLRIQGRDLDTTGSNTVERGVNFVINQGGTPNSAQITLDLKDVPLSEALRYLTELAGMKYKIEPNAVVIVPLSDTTSEQYTRVYEVPKSFSEKLRFTSAIEFLKEQGIQFPDGSSASFDSRSSRLAVKNTQPNLDLVERVVQVVINLKPGEPMPDVFGPGLGVSSSAKSGLIPLELDLPSSGQLLHFSGTQAPEVLELRFTSWERQMAWACGLMAAGGLVFAIWGRRRAMLRTLLVVLVLSLGVKLFAEDRLPLANAALFGWLVALAIWMVFRICAGISKRTGGGRYVEA
ncbi:MAG: hypothetical protein K1X78_28670 [Verrucomicrobiaceae bacterium]|nr:hypothetical protein [Verrucomicrobiaceae bacterium]